MIINVTSDADKKQNAENLQRAIKRSASYTRKQLRNIRYTEQDLQALITELIHKQEEDMSITLTPPSITEMREFVAEYLRSRYPLTEIKQDVFDDDTIKEMYSEVNSKYRE